MEIGDSWKISQETVATSDLELARNFERFVPYIGVEIKDLLGVIWSLKQRQFIR